MIPINREQPSGESLLTDVYGFLGRFVAYPSEEAHIAHTLWVAHAHGMDAWETTPRLAFLSPEPASGKTRALEITELLVPNPVLAINVTPTYLFRKVGDDEGKPTILFDEIDTVFGPKAKDNEEIRGLLNAGHRRGSYAGRCLVKGKTVETEEIPAFSAVALAGLGGLPDTILSRSVIVRMKRRAPGEYVEPYRVRDHSPEGEALRERLAQWVASQLSALRDARPVMPEGIEDRDADVWEPLLAIADAAGGDWPGRARVAAVALVADSKRDTPSLGVRLLKDIRAVFGDSTESISTSELIEGLVAIDEAPWRDLRGGPLNARGLSQRLSQYQIASRNIRNDGTVLKGYRREDFYDAWARYLSCDPPKSENGDSGNFSPPPYESATSATSATEDAPRCSSCGASMSPARVSDICGDCQRFRPPDTSDTQKEILL